MNDISTNAELNALLARVGEGDREAFGDLYRALEKPVHNFITSRLNDSSQSNDLLHDVFIDIWKGAARFEGRSTVKTWVFGIAYRKVMDVFRKGGRMIYVAEVPGQIDDSPSAEQSLFAAQKAEYVQKCLGELKPEHRTAIELAFFQDFGYREIAEIIGAPEGTIKTRVFYAKKVLLHCLKKHIDPGEI